MKTTATSRAAKLVARTRRRATLRAWLRSLLGGVAAGTFLAAAAVSFGHLVGYAPGLWLIACVAPAVVVTVRSLLRSRVSPRSAALLLDRSARTKERFIASAEAEDLEVRELAATQALESPRVAGGRLPVRFPPSGEGLAAALGIFLLVGVLLLTGGGEPVMTVDGPSHRAEAPPANATASPGSGGEDGLLSGEDLTEEERRRLADHGVAEEDLEAIRAALSRGDASKAARLLDAALNGGGTDPAPSPEERAALRWGDYEAALAEPGWSPRYDRIVRRYFERVRPPEPR